jgi:integration host factor subunit alpha
MSVSRQVGRIVSTIKNGDDSSAKLTTVTKADIVERVYDSLREIDGNFSKKESAEIVEKVLETIKSELEQGELPRKIKISGFGNFVVREKGERTGRNPQTNDAITIAPRRVLTFKPSQVLKNSINNCGAES